MSPEQWERVKSLYGAALECDAPTRAGFLRQREQDHQVVDEVLRLLAEQSKLSGFLSTPPLLDPTLLDPTLMDPTVSAREAGTRVSTGEVLAGRFRILGFIAAGGMGEVYKAEDTRLDRTVALKFLPREMAENRPALERLRGEAKAASTLNHPNICTVYDFGEEAGRAFIAMEFLEGETLSARLRRGPLPVDQALQVAISVASALSTAHRKGIIHRDLKPGNIMLTGTGVKLLDFGLAKRQRPTLPDAETASLVTRVTGVAGTLPYMSPEQLKCGEVDARGDIFAFGAVLYEMLTGAKAFGRKSSSETIAALIHEEPRPLKELAKSVPPELERMVARCLRKHSDERYSSMQQVEQELEDFRAKTAGGITLKRLWQQRKRPAVAIPVVLSFMLLAVLAAWWIHHDAKVKWARNQVLPQIAQLVEAEKFGDAYALAVQAERYIPHDPMLVQFWDKVSYSIPISTTPPGAAVYRKDYGAAQDHWEFVGISPIGKHRFPSVDSRWKFARAGFATVERATFAEYPNDSITVAMTEESKAPSGMVHVTIQHPGSSEGVLESLYYLPGFTQLPPIRMQDYWIDKYEVTNRQFKAFLDAGGYRNQAYWDQEFRKDGRSLPWSEAMTLFRDTTGRPGPATWVQGEYPSGQDDYPVSGVSWYEAAAYAKFVGKSLPTIYHWKTAATRHASASIVPASNFSMKGPARVGSYQGVSTFGAYDMAGNVKEWIWNQEISGKHFVLGGAWNEPEVEFVNADARSPFDRMANLGFRCATYSLTGEYAKAAEVIDREMRDYSKEKPVSDGIFRAYRNLYSYDKAPLNARIESVRSAGDWDLQKIAYDAAYGNERITAFLYLPRKASPPFQVVMYFPGALALVQRSSDNHPELENFDFIIKSGRAVMLPVYKGTYERKDGFEFGRKDTSRYRDHMLAWVKDFSRSIDYLETRPDIDARKLGYLGESWGAALGAILPALDPRPKALILDRPGFYLQKFLPEVDPFNFARHVTTPVLMLNGRYDFVFPTNSSQEPMFRLLGTPEKDKRRVVYDTAHDTPRPELIKESLNWLDRYLGPVN